MVTAAGGVDTAVDNTKNGGKEDGVKSTMCEGEDDKYYGGEDPPTRLRRYEGKMAEIASEFEEGMVRF